MLRLAVRDPGMLACSPEAGAIVLVTDMCVESELGGCSVVGAPADMLLIWRCYTSLTCMRQNAPVAWHAANRKSLPVESLERWPCGLITAPDKSFSTSADFQDCSCGSCVLGTSAAEGNLLAVGMATDIGMMLPATGAVCERVGRRVCTTGAKPLIVLATFAGSLSGTPFSPPVKLRGICAATLHACWSPCMPEGIMTGWKLMGESAVTTCSAVLAPMGPVAGAGVLDPPSTGV